MNIKSFTGSIFAFITALLYTHTAHSMRQAPHPAIHTTSKHICSDSCKGQSTDENGIFSNMALVRHIAQFLPNHDLCTLSRVNQTLFYAIRGCTIQAHTFSDLLAQRTIPLLLEKQKNPLQFLQQKSSWKQTR